MIPWVTSYYVKTGRGIKSLFYVNTPRNNKPEADGALILPLPTPVGGVLRSGNVAVCNLHVPYTDRLVYHIVY